METGSGERSGAAGESSGATGESSMSGVSLRSSFALRGVGEAIVLTLPPLSSQGERALSGRGAEPGVTGRDVGVTEPRYAGDPAVAGLPAGDS